MCILQYVNKITYWLYRLTTVIIRENDKPQKVKIKLLFDDKIMYKLYRL